MSSHELPCATPEGETTFPFTGEQLAEHIKNNTVTIHYPTDNSAIRDAKWREAQFNFAQGKNVFMVPVTLLPALPATIEVSE